MALKDGSYKGPHWATRRALLEMLKTRGELSSLEMAEQMGVSSMAVRQHMQELEVEEDVTFENRSMGKGRPTKYWLLTAKAARHFPDRHRDLMLDLLGNMQNVLGNEAMDRLLDVRSEQQTEAYKTRLARCGSLVERVKELAEIRSEEGYMAEVLEEDGELKLVENHCPICDAASTCTGLCDRELQVFSNVLGSSCNVERVEHMLDNARRCSYRISEKG